MNRGKIATILLLLITANLYWLSKTGIGEITTQPLISLSQILALLGVTLLSVTFVLSSRARWLEKWFEGLDKLYKFHHKVGVVAFVMLLHHPLLLAVEALPNFRAATIYLFPSPSLAYSAGVAGLYSMVLLLIATILIKLPYRIWLMTHELMGTVLLFSFIHVLQISSDVSNYMPLRYWILAVMSVAAGSVVYKRFLYWKFGPKVDVTLVEVKRKDDLIELFFKPSKKFDFQPGQFGFLKITKKGADGDMHPFSFSSSPDEELVRMSIKIEGRYTLKLREMKVGDKALIYGPYGMLSRNFFGDDEVVVIAGGIGITPFMSMLKAEEKKPRERKIKLIYSNKNKEGVMYREEIEEIDKKLKNLEVDFYESEKEGRLDSEKVIKIIGGGRKRYYLCGPQGLIMSLSDGLIKKGINPHLIHFEDFALR